MISLKLIPRFTGRCGGKASRRSWCDEATPLLRRCRDRLVLRTLRLHTLPPPLELDGDDASSSTALLEPDEDDVEEKPLQKYKESTGMRVLHGLGYRDEAGSDDLEGPINSGLVVGQRVCVVMYLIPRVCL